MFGAQRQVDLEMTRVALEPRRPVDRARAEAGVRFFSVGSCKRRSNHRVAGFEIVVRGQRQWSKRAVNLKQREVGELSRPDKLRGKCSLGSFETNLVCVFDQAKAGQQVAVFRDEKSAAGAFGGKNG